jgi:hypothetical protein
MADLDEVIDRLRELVEELEGVINDLWGLSIRCKCGSRELGSPENPPREATVLGNTVRGDGK